MDTSRRALERAAATGDARAAAQLRAAQLRAGEPVEFKPGDEVLVNEVESPWMRVPWRGIVVRLWQTERHDGSGYDTGAYVRPVGDPGSWTALPWRVRPCTAYLERGVFVTFRDLAASHVTRPAVPA